MQSIWERDREIYMRHGMAICTVVCEAWKAWHRAALLNHFHTWCEFSRCAAKFSRQHIAWLSVRHSALNVDRIQSSECRLIFTHALRTRTRWNEIDNFVLVKNGWMVSFLLIFTRHIDWTQNIFISNSLFYFDFPFDAETKFCCSTCQHVDCQTLSVHLYCAMIRRQPNWCTIKINWCNNLMWNKI